MDANYKDCGSLIEEYEEAASSLGSASVSLAVSRILRDTSSERFTAKAEEELFVIGEEMKKRLPHPLSNISDPQSPPTTHRLLNSWTA
jgi:hypothetical protein